MSFEESNVMTALADPLSYENLIRLGHPQTKDYALEQFCRVLARTGAILEVDDAPLLFVSPAGVLVQEYEIDLLFFWSLEEIYDRVAFGIENGLSFAKHLGVICSLKL